mmetsp:Transcript_12295/g.23892  ORF Transcript_12295/g.23892 Transcript_12295/m.23892 type:complete len:561 (-) Transcript_12295:219-1901(-)|eukprot:CAMPEP_0171497194 /NCGR_PEP_ID=MMETSP0958-20121227/7130_1 /TAXON_ID=87120 /ORGANISM="Aurantiochytrium limacinum, Strain ATCCMYA-1381" /LENGTH=560 /DNA_ID=CAMNT_0012031397 /DNA_START=453 /DNA_END=2135 /DNA_ORIENTATION=+
MQVYAWGRGEDGQLGLGDACDQFKPRLIESLSEKEVSSVVCGSGHTVVLSKDGEVYTWGRGDDGRLGHGDQGWKHEPRLVTAIKSKVVAQVTCGSYHTAAVTDTGELYTWGGGMYGKLGHGNENGHSIPRKVEALKDKCVIQVACGSRHTVVLVSNSTSQNAGLGSKGVTDVYSWGDSDNGVSGQGDSVDGHQYYPALLTALQNRQVCQVAACGFHTGAVTENGEVYTWGEGKFGRLGHGSEVNQHTPKLIECEKIKDRRIVQIACGGFHTAAITDKGELFTWGGGEHGQLGHGNKENYQRPTRVKALTKSNILQVTCGWSHTVVLDNEGCVWTFGNGDHGKLGHGDTEKVIVPQKVEGLSNKRIVRVASYNEHTAALAVPLEQNRDLPNSTLVQDYKSVVNSRDFSDVCFLVENRRIYAHRVIVAARCAHFRAMFSSGMKESHEKEIHIGDTRHDVFLALLHFLYTDCVDVSAEIAIELYVLADLYALDRLKSNCETIVHQKLCQSNAPVLLSIADQHQAHDLKSLCTEYIVRHFEVISKMPEFAVLNRDLILEILQSR